MSGGELGPLGPEEKTARSRTERSPRVAGAAPAYMPVPTSSTPACVQSAACQVKAVTGSLSPPSQSAFGSSAAGMLWRAAEKAFDGSGAAGLPISGATHGP